MNFDETFAFWWNQRRSSGSCSSRRGSELSISGDRKPHAIVDADDVSDAAASSSEPGNLTAISIIQLIAYYNAQIKIKFVAALDFKLC